MAEQFISEEIRPLRTSFDAARMSNGEPGMPRKFQWRTNTVEVIRIVRSWRETGPCRHGSGERYVRKHWFEVVTDENVRMKIYFDRHPRRHAKRHEPRWWVFSIEDSEDGTSADRS